jgi:serine protease Do
MISGIRTFKETQFIQLDARVNPGNSGGPVMDNDFNLMGVVTAKAVGYSIEGLGFAVPTSEILSTLKIHYK